MIETIQAVLEQESEPISSGPERAQNPTDGDSLNTIYACLTTNAQ